MVALRSREEFLPTVTLSCCAVPEDFPVAGDTVTQESLLEALQSTLAVTDTVWEPPASLNVSEEGDTLTLGVSLSPPLPPHAVRDKTNAADARDDKILIAFILLEYNVLICDILLPYKL
jgi:hypothetical protein